MGSPESTSDVPFRPVDERPLEPKEHVSVTADIALFHIAGEPETPPGEPASEPPQAITPLPPSPSNATRLVPPAPAISAPSSVKFPARPRPGSWRQCVNHRRVRSETMCPTCAVGYCRECKQPICLTCDNPCVSVSEYQKWLQQERLRARPMIEEVKTILTYPFRDPMAFVLFALFTGFFGFAARFSPRAIVFSQGILLWYSFHALYQVAGGNLKHFIPDFNDISDLIRPLWLSAGCWLVTWGPLLLLATMFTVNVGMGTDLGSVMGGAPTVHQEPYAASSEADDPALAQMQELLGGLEDEGAAGGTLAAGVATEEQSFRQPSLPAADLSGPDERSFGVSVLLLLALVWKVAYVPAALIVAGLSKRIAAVLNPLAGIDIIRRMGPVYWHAMLIYTMLAAAELGIGKILGLFPLVGGFGMSFVEAYIALTVGCTLGLAVYKKAPELGWG